MKFYSGFLIGLQAADVCLTKIGLSLNSNLSEGNPIGVWALHLGTTGLIIAKVVSTLIVLTLLWCLKPYYPKLTNNLLVYSCMLMSIVVIYNGGRILHVLHN